MNGEEIKLIEEFIQNGVFEDSNNIKKINDIIYNAYNNRIIMDFNWFLRIIKTPYVNKKKYDITNNPTNLFNFQLNNLEWMKEVEDKVDNQHQPFISRYTNNHNYVLTNYKIYNNKILYYQYCRNYTPPYCIEYNNAELNKINNLIFKLQIKGGLLMDEMGCGKTATIITYCLNNMNKFVKESIFHAKTNLIIVPNHIVMQWASEIQKFKGNYNPKVLIIEHMKDIEPYTYNSLMDFDFIITSYSIFSKIKCKYEKITRTKVNCPASSDFAIIYEGCRKMFNRPNILNTPVNPNFIYWNRIILDEFQDFSCSRYADIRSKYRWCCSGTPYAEDTINDTIHYLIERETKYNFNDKDYNFMINNRKHKLQSELLRIFIDNNLYRHNTIDAVKREATFNIKINYTDIWLEFSRKEQVIYNSLSKKDINDLSKKLCLSLLLLDGMSNCKTLDEAIGQIIIEYREAINKNNKSIITYEKKITKLLITAEKEPDIQKKNSIIRDTEKIQKKIDEIQISIDMDNRQINFMNNCIAENSKECNICLGEYDATLTIKTLIPLCGHIYCRDCLSNNALDKCPSCRKKLDKSKFITIHNEPIPEDNNNDIQGVKLLNIINKLNELLANPENNIILFVQWGEILENLRKFLADFNINTVVCRGDIKERTTAIEQFKSKKCRIIMLSLENASHGTNLTEANKIVFVNPVKKDSDVEQQAIARTYRIGQTRDIDVIKFVIKGTVEEELIK